MTMWYLSTFYTDHGCPRMSTDLQGLNTCAYATSKLAVLLLMRAWRYYDKKAARIMPAATRIMPVATRMSKDHAGNNTDVQGSCRQENSIRDHPGWKLNMFNLNFPRRRTIKDHHGSNKDHHGSPRITTDHHGCPRMFLHPWWSLEIRGQCKRGLIHTHWISRRRACFLVTRKYINISTS